MERVITEQLVCSMITDDRYNFVRQLGNGSFAAVGQYEDKDTSEHVAIKQIYVQKGYIPDVLVQVNQMRAFQNEHIIRYRDCFYDSEELYLNIVMELGQGSLRGQLEHKRMFSQLELISFITQMTSAFLDLQNKMVIHLDLKPQNILVIRQSEQGTPSHYKICDFGCSQIAEFSKMSGYEKSAFGTLNYLAPQNHVKFQGKKTRSGADVWSLGVTLYEMMFWKLPFPADNSGVMVTSKIIEYLQGKGPGIDFTLNNLAPQKVIGLVKQMLKPKPLDRINWKQIKQYLKEQLESEPYEFDSVFKAYTYVFPRLQLLKKVLDVAKQQENQQIYQSLTHYCFLVGLKLRQRIGYKFWQLDKKDAVKLEKILASLEQHESDISGRTESEVLQECSLKEQQAELVKSLATNNKSSQLVKAFCSDVTKAIEWDRCILDEGVLEGSLALARS